METKVEKVVKLNIDTVLNITGRGEVFVVDLKANGLCSEKWVREIPIKKDAIVVASPYGVQKTYMVIGVETQRTQEGDALINSTVGLLVREMKDTFSEADLVSFGNYVVSPRRKERFKSHNSPDVSLEERLAQVHHADIENWKALHK